MIHDFKRHHFGKRSEAYHHSDQQQFDFLQDVEPAKVIETESVTIEKHTRKKVVACKQHCEGSTQTAKAQKRFLPKTGVTERFIANIIVSKFDDR